MSFRCWLVNEMDETDGIVVEDVWDREVAAQEACDRWYERGAFAGDELGGSVDVHVRDAEGCLWLVEVRIDWSPTFTGSKWRRVEEAPRESGT